MLSDLSVKVFEKLLHSIRLGWEKEQTRRILFKVLVQFDDLIDCKFIGMLVDYLVRAEWAHFAAILLVQALWLLKGGKSLIISFMAKS